MKFFGSSKRKKDRSMSRSESPSFGSSTSDESIGGHRHRRSTTPRSVLDSVQDGGKITRGELEAVLRRLGPDPPTEEELEAMLAEAELGESGSGRISLAALASLGGGADLGPPEMRDTFAVFDSDGDGRISAEELLGVFHVLGDDSCSIHDCRRIIGNVAGGGYGDGFVCFDDFVRMMGCQR